MFRKVGTRAAQAISKTVAAGTLWLRRDGTVRELRFALGSMAPTVRRLKAVESFVVGRRMTPKIVRDAAAEVRRYMRIYPDAPGNDRLQFALAELHFHADQRKLAVAAYRRLRCSFRRATSSPRLA